MAAIIVGMKIFIKTLKGEKTEFEVQPEDTVASLKQRVKDSQGHEPELQKLIAFGKIMEDTKALAEYNLKENDQIVLMVTKPKPQPRQPDPVPVQSPPSHSSDPPQRVAPPAPPLQGPEFEQAVQRVMELGFPRDQVESALRMAHGNPDLAIQVLMGEGMPMMAARAGQQAGRRAGSPAATAPAGQAGESPFAFLRENPAMLQIRAEIQRNPALLQSFIQQLAQSNPGLARIIAQHPEEFRAFLSETGPQINPSLINALPRMDQPAPARPQLRLSPEEMAAVQNLASLGFARNDALEAYLSCDKNEAMAANLLFENYVPLAEQEEQRRAREAPPRSSEQPPRSSEQPPGDQPPSDQAPSDQPPSDQPPSDQPPSDQPPSSDPPGPAS